MDDRKLLETVADIAYIAGYHQHYSGDSRVDMSDYIVWAKEFEETIKNTDWDESDYMLFVEKFAYNKLFPQSKCFE
jgi:hypothetical protein